MFVTVLLLFPLFCGDTLAQFPVGGPPRPGGSSGGSSGGSGCSASNCSYPSSFDEPCQGLEQCLLCPGSDNGVKIPPYGNLTIDVAIFLQSFIGVDLLSQTVKTSTLIRLRWNDTRVMNAFADFSDCPASAAPIPQAYNIWYPRFSVVNSVDSISSSTLDTTSLIAYPSGNVFLNFETRLDVSCNMNLLRFPFDSHICFFHVVPTRDFMTSGSPTASTTVSVAQTSSLLKASKAATANPLFEMGQTCTLIGSKETYMFAHAYFLFVMKRNVSYYWPVVFAPTAVISVLMAVVFITDADDGEKLSVALTVLLSYFVVSYSLSAQLPVTSVNIPWIYYFYAYETIVSTLATVFAVFIRNRSKAELDEELFSETPPEKKHKITASCLNTTALVLYCLFFMAGYAVYFGIVACSDTPINLGTVDGETSTNCTLTDMSTAKDYVSDYKGTGKSARTGGGPGAPVPGAMMGPGAMVGPGGTMGTGGMIGTSGTMGSGAGSFNLPAPLSAPTRTGTDNSTSSSNQQAALPAGSFGSSSSGAPAPPALPKSQ